jgi:tetratricopeptide (TPR) repeat protein
MTPGSVSLFLLLIIVAQAQPPQGSRPAQPEFLRQGQQLLRDGKANEALALYQQTIQQNPGSIPAHNAAGVALDLMGRYPEARQHFMKALELAAAPQAKAAAERSLAMSYAFEGNCKETVNHEQKVLDYYVAEKDFYQQGEIANEAARVCIDAGDLDMAAKWYQIGHDRGVQEPDIKPDRKDLWEFRTENALARIAARRGNTAEAQRHVAAAKAALDRGTNPTQMIFLPYLTGYVAFYSGDYKMALTDLQKANQSDPFIQSLIGQTYEKLGQKESAMEAYRKAAATTAHNPPAAFARPFATRKLSS